MYSTFKYPFLCSHFLEWFPVSFRLVSNGKSNIIRDLNVENKLLYGKLLETRKQRQRSLAMGKSNIKKKSEATTKEDDDVTVKNLKHQLKGKNCVTQNKKTQSNSKLSEQILKSSATTKSLFGEGASEILDETKSNEQDVKKKRNKKIKSNKSSEEAEAFPTNETLRESTSPTSSEQLTSRTGVLISDANYPLENPLRPVIKDYCVDSVVKYGFKDPLVKKYANLPSVSKIIEATMSEKNKLILSKWRQRMIKTLGEEGFNKYSEETLAQGQEFHEAVRKTVLGEAAGSYTGVIGKALQSLSWVLDQVSQPLAVESILAHPELGYKGISDCVASFRDVPVVIDWKLSEKPKRDIKDTFEAPVQVTAYIGALNHDPNYKCSVNHGLVAVAYHSGEPCDVFLLSPKHCQVYWRHWLQRVDKFKARSHLHLDHDIDEKSLNIN